MSSGRGTGQKTAPHLHGKHYCAPVWGPAAHAGGIGSVTLAKAGFSVVGCVRSLITMEGLIVAVQSSLGFAL